MVSRETPKDLLRAEPGSSPFEVSGVLALHGGGGSSSGVGRMGVSENLGGLLPGTRPKYPQSRGGDSPEACKAGRRRWRRRWQRRSGYHGEPADSSHCSWAPKHWSSPDPPRAVRARLSARRMRSCDSYGLRRLSVRPWLLRQI